MLMGSFAFPSTSDPLLRARPVDESRAVSGGGAPEAAYKRTSPSKLVIYEVGKLPDPFPIAKAVR
jgi:hypothetical protein